MRCAHCRGWSLNFRWHSKISVDGPPEEDRYLYMLDETEAGRTFTGIEPACLHAR